MSDIRLATSIIIEKDGEYLVGAFGMLPRWSNSPYDAWMTRDRVSAHAVSWAVQGNILLFNPIVGQIKLWRKYT